MALSVSVTLCMNVNRNVIIPTTPMIFVMTSMIQFV